MVGNKKIIAVCVARIQDDASNEYVAALNDIAAPAGYGVLVYNNKSYLLLFSVFLILSIYEIYRAGKLSDKY